MTIQHLLAAAALCALGIPPGLASSAEADSVLSNIPEVLITADNQTVARDEAVKGKLIGLYFSAHWCSPCRAFTPTLVEFRNRHAAEFEVVFVSFDRSPEVQLQYMKEAKMPWPAVRSDGAEGKALAERFGLRGIPSLVILDPEGRPLSTEGRNELIRDGDGALAKWKKHVPQSAAPSE